MGYTSLEATSKNAPITLSIYNAVDDAEEIIFSACVPKKQKIENYDKKSTITVINETEIGTITK